MSKPENNPDMKVLKTATCKTISAQVHPELSSRI